jgi:hypothetical protein
VAVSDELGVLLDKRIPEVLIKFDIKISFKPAASLPHNVYFTTIGADYDTSRAHIDGSVIVTPRVAIAEKFLIDTDNIIAAGGASFEQLESYAGSAEFVGRFGAVSCGVIHRAREAARHHKGKVALGHGDFYKALVTLRQSVAQCKGVALVMDPSFAAPALHGCHGDASTTGGYGATVNGLCCCGPWPESIKRLLAKEAVSISPLEMVVAALVVLVAEEARAPKRFVLFSDSESSVVVAARGRAHAAAMDVALAAFKEAQCKTKRDAWICHIDGVQNTVADALSHASVEGRHDFAMTTLRAHGFNPQPCPTPPIFFEWLSRIEAVARIWT